MAEIKKNDIIEDGVFSNAIDNSKELLGLMNKLDEEFVNISKSAKKVSQTLDFGKVDGVEKFLKLEKEVSNQTQQQIALMKKRKTVKDQLRQATDEQVKATLRYKQATAEQRKELKLELDLEKAQVGSLKRLRLESKKLRNEKDNLNLSTKEGQRRLKEINRQLDLNNQALERNATQLGKQKIGIGRYSKAISQNILRYAGWTAVISGLTRVLRSVSRDVVAFEKAQADLAGVLGKSRKEIKLLTSEAKRLGSTTIFKPKQVSALQKEFAKLGFNIGQIQNMTKATLDFATATNTELPRSAEIVGNTLNAFQLGAEETTRVVNVMNESFSRSALDSERFSIAMGKVGAVATQAGMSLEQTTATLGTLVSNGIRAETAGTGLRNILLKVSETGEDLDTVLKEINGSTDRVATATKKFGTQNTAVALTMATMQKESKELTKQLEEQGRTAESVAKEQMDTLSGSMKQLSSAWDGFILALEEGDGVISRVFTNIVDYHTWLLEAWTKVVTSSKDLFSQSIADESLKKQEEALQEVNDVMQLIGKSSEELLSKDNDLTEAQLKNAKRIVKLRKEGLKEIEIVSKLLGERAFFSKKELDDREDLLNKQLEAFNSYRDKLNKEQVKQYEQEFRDSFVALAKQRTLLDQHLETIKKSIKNSSNDELEILKNSTDKKVALEAQYEIARRKLNGNGTEDDKKNNKKRLKNHKEYLSRKLELEKEYRRLVKELDEEIFEQEKQLQIENNERRLKSLQEQIEFEKESGVISIENLNKLLEEERRIKEENNRLEREIQFRELDLQFAEEEKRISENEAKRKEDVLRRFEEGQITEQQKNEELKQIYKDYIEALNKIDEKRQLEKERGKQDEIEANREANKELLEQQEDYNKSVIEAQQKANEEEEKLWEEKNEKRKKAFQETVETLNAIGQAFAEKQQEMIAKEIENIDALIGKSKTRVDELRKNSDANQQTVESNIAFEEAKQAQLEKQKLEAEKKARQIELATTAVEVYSNKVANDDPNPLVNTIKDITLLQQFVKNIPLFWEGTDTTVGESLGAPHLNTARDGYIVRVDAKEKILNPYLSAMTGDMTTKEIAQVAYNHRMGIADYTNPFDLSNQSVSVSNSMSNIGTMLLQREMQMYRQEQQETNQKLDELISKPVSSIFYDDTNAIPKIVQQTVQGNKVVTKNRFLR